VFSNVAAKFYFYPGPWLGRICPIGAFMIHKGALRGKILSPSTAFGLLPYMI